jgi:hypothetical protein
LGASTVKVFIAAISFPECATAAERTEFRVDFDAPTGAVVDERSAIAQVATNLDAFRRVAKPSLL